MRANITRANPVARNRRPKVTSRHLDIVQTIADNEFFDALSGLFILMLADRRGGFLALTDDLLGRLSPPRLCACICAIGSPIASRNRGRSYDMRSSTGCATFRTSFSLRDQLGLGFTGLHVLTLLIAEKS